MEIQTNAMRKKRNSNSGVMSTPGGKLDKHDDRTSGYKPDPSIETMLQAVCHFLNWGADKHPYHIYSWNAVAKAVFQRPKMPRDGSDEVHTVYKTGSRLRDYMQKHYQREFFTIRGTGVRASVDTDDIVVNGRHRPMRRVFSAIKSLQSMRELVNPADISNTPAMKAHKEFFMKGVIPACNMLGSLAEKLKALEPVPSEDKK